MRVNHELERGVICEKCNKVVYKGNYVRIQTLEPIVEDTTGRCKTINRINLCRECHKEYKQMIKILLGRL